MSFQFEQLFKFDNSINISQYMSNTSFVELQGVSWKMFYPNIER